MTELLVLELKPTDDYTKWLARCAYCRIEWFETTHDLWNVAAVSCPFCNVMQGINTKDFHGDQGVDPDNWWDC